MSYLLLKTKKQNNKDVSRGENASSHVRLVFLEVTLHDIRSD